MRDLDRERTKMEQQEKKVIADIKKMAKQGQMVGNGEKEMSLYLLICVNYYKHFYKNKILSTNQKQELPVVAMFVNGSGRNEHSL
jgi:hypothetical protein